MKRPIQRLFLTLFAFAILVGASAWVRAEGFEERHRVIPLLIFLGASILGFLANLLRFQAHRASAILFFYFPAFIVPLAPWLSGYLPAWRLPGPPDPGGHARPGDHSVCGPPVWRFVPIP